MTDLFSGNDKMGHFKKTERFPGIKHKKKGFFWGGGGGKTPINLDLIWVER